LVPYEGTLQAFVADLAINGGYVLGAQSPREAHRHLADQKEKNPSKKTTNLLSLEGHTYCRLI